MSEKKTSEKNLLLISMSKFNFNLMESYYHHWDHVGYYFRGVSQLETGTKLYLRKLQKSREKFDRIFIVESNAVRSEKKEVSHMLTPDELCFSERKGEEVHATAVEFYKERISQYIRGVETAHGKTENSNQETLNRMQEKIDVYEEKARMITPSLMELYPEISKLFQDIEMNDAPEEGETDEGAIYSCVYELCREIQRFSEDGTRVNLYLDMQGARRYETFIINAAVKMLEMSNVAVKTSIATDFAVENNKGGKWNEIVDTTINDRIFEMVSGMNEFLKTGRGDTLRQFWESSHALIGLEQEKGMIEEIIRISEAISLCDVAKFDESLATFSKEIEAYEKADQKHPLFQTFARDLKKNYEKYHLLENNGKSKTSDQIHWCLDKKLYQQALTLVEAKIPDDLVDNKICYYGDEIQLQNLLNQGRKNGWRGGPYYYWKRDKARNEKIIPDKAKFVWIKYALIPRRNKKKLSESNTNIASEKNEEKPSETNLNIASEKNHQKYI